MPTADACPGDPDSLLRGIVNVKKRTLAVWGVASLVIMVAMVFVAYSLMQDILEWMSMRRQYAIRMKGRNNVFDASDDNYEPQTGTTYTAPSGRAIMHRLRAMPCVGRDVLDPAKDKYEEDPKDDDYVTCSATGDIATDRPASVSADKAKGGRAKGGKAKGDDASCVAA
jgi:hypothetical protein